MWDCSSQCYIMSELARMREIDTSPKLATAHFQFSRPLREGTGISKISSYWCEALNTGTTRYNKAP